MSKDLCKDYDLKGYCLRGAQCPDKHGADLISLDVSDYEGLRRAVDEAVAQSKLEQNQLRRKQTELLSILVEQQKTLIDKIEQCSDEAEKVRFQTALSELSQKIKVWIANMQSVHSREPEQNLPSTSKVNEPTACSSSTDDTSDKAPKDGAD